VLGNNFLDLAYVPVFASKVKIGLIVLRHRVCPGHEWHGGMQIVMRILHDSEHVATDRYLERWVNVFKDGRYRCQNRFR